MTSNPLTARVELIELEEQRLGELVQLLTESLHHLVASGCEPAQFSTTKLQIRISLGDANIGLIESVNLCDFDLDSASFRFEYEEVTSGENGYRAR